MENHIQDLMLREVTNFIVCEYNVTARNFWVSRRYLEFLINNYNWDAYKYIFDKKKYLQGMKDSEYLQIKEKIFYNNVRNNQFSYPLNYS